MNEWTEQRGSLNLSQLSNRVFFPNSFLTLTRFGSALIIIKRSCRPLWMTAFICLKIKNMEKMYVKWTFSCSKILCALGFSAFVFHSFRASIFFIFLPLLSPLWLTICLHFSLSCLPSLVELVFNKNYLSLYLKLRKLMRLWKVVVISCCKNANFHSGVPPLDWL